MKPGEGRGIGRGVKKKRKIQRRRKVLTSRMNPRLSKIG